MFPAKQYRAKAAEYAELVKTASNADEEREFRKLEMSFLALASNLAVEVARKELAERKAPRPVMSIGASIANRLKSLRRKGSGKVVATR